MIKPFICHHDLLTSQICTLILLGATWQEYQQEFISLASSLRYETIAEFESTKKQIKSHVSYWEEKRQELAKEIGRHDTLLSDLKSCEKVIESNPLFTYATGRKT